MLMRSVEPKTYINSSVFINKLQIKNASKLRVKEAEFTTVRSLEIYLAPTIMGNSFDLNYLCAIHNYLFQDIYEWAGLLRSYDIVKEGSVFTPAHELSLYEQDVFQKAIELSSRLDKIPRPDFIQQITQIFSLLNKYHPFPDGNGRSQRVFITLLIAKCGYQIDFSGTAPWEMIEICKQAHFMNKEPMLHYFDRVIA